MKLRTGSIVVVTFAFAFAASGQPTTPHGPGQGNQHRHGQSLHAGGHHDTSMNADREVFHFLLDNGGKIARTITMLDDGIESLTESDDPEIAAKIREHVASMNVRISEENPVHMRDPLFAEIFQNADKITMAVEDTKKGARVRETSDDAYVAKLIQAHAEVITRFLENGRTEACRNHEAPAP